MTTLRRAFPSRGLAVVAILGLAGALLVLQGAGPSHPRHGRAHRLTRGWVTAARPIFDGDRFRIDPRGVFHGGGGRLPPYQWSSAWEEGRGFLSHSNTDPDVMGVTMGPDPTGIARQVIKIRADERQNNGKYTRMELRGPNLFKPGMTDWVISEIYIRPGTPTMPSSRDWWTTMEVYGPPYAGTGPLTIGLGRNARGTGNDFVWRTATGAIRWRRPAPDGVWFIIARRIHFADDASGWVEIYESHRGHSGEPTGPLRIQRLANGRTRWSGPTLDPANDGGPNHFDLKNYHIANMWPHRVYTDLYFARARVYSGDTPLIRIDPWDTGLR